MSEALASPSFLQGKKNRTKVSQSEIDGGTKYEFATFSDEGDVLLTDNYYTDGKKHEDQLLVEAHYRNLT